MISKEFHIELMDRAVALNIVNDRHWCKSEVKWLEGVLDPGYPALPDARNIWRNSVGDPLLCTTTRSRWLAPLDVGGALVNYIVVVE